MRETSRTKGSAVTPTERVILAVLKRGGLGGNVRVKDICYVTRLGGVRVGRDLRKLRQRGLVRQTCWGYWRAA